MKYNIIMNPILIVVIFCIILFFYLHIQFQFKTSNDLELFEIYETTKEGMEEICNMRQPTVFNHVDDQLVNATITKLNADVLSERYPQYSVQVREEDCEEYASLPLTAATQLMSSSPSFGESATHGLNKCFYSENNRDFLAETGALKNISDRMLRPSLCNRAENDVLFGTEGCTTPMRFNINYRNYYLCTKGIVYIKLVPPKYTSKLDAIYDYDLFEFRTPHNLWTNNPKIDVKSLEIALTPGKILFIPAYWWYSFQFGPHTSVASFKYRTYMNTVATLGHSVMYFLQQHNIRKKFVKPATLNAKKKEDNDDHLFAKKESLNKDTNISPLTQEDILANTPTPVVNTPTPVVNTPTPVVNTPTPVVNTPTPVVNTPTPVVNTPEISLEPNIIHTVSEIPSNEIPLDEIPSNEKVETLDETNTSKVAVDEKDNAIEQTEEKSENINDDKKEEINELD